MIPSWFDQRVSHLARDILKDVTKQKEFPEVCVVSDSDKFVDEVKTHLPENAVVLRRDENHLREGVFMPPYPVALIDPRISNPGLVSKLQGTNSVWKTPRLVIEATPQNLSTLEKSILNQVQVNTGNLIYRDRPRYFRRSWDFTKKNGILVVSGPTGAGKTTFAKEYCKRYPNSQFLVKSTSRPPRSGEVEGEDYFFISREKIQDLEKRGDLINYEYLEHLYGIPTNILQLLDEGKDIVTAANLPGVKALEEGLDKMGNKTTVTEIALWRMANKVRDSLINRGSKDRLNNFSNDYKLFSKYFGRFDNYVSMYHIPGVMVHYIPGLGLRFKHTSSHPEDSSGSDSPKAIHARMYQQYKKDLALQAKDPQAWEFYQRFQPDWDDAVDDLESYFGKKD